MYERFTDRARKVMQLANQEAQRFHHEYIGTEHILLGLLKQKGGVGFQVLADLGATAERITAEIEKILRDGPTPRDKGGRLPHTPRAKKVIEFAVEEARNLSHNYVGTEHLLLGLIREEQGVAAVVLMNLGVTLEAARAGVARLRPPGAQHSDYPTDQMTPEPLPNLLTEFQSFTFRELIRALNEKKESLVLAHDFEAAARCRDAVKALERVVSQLEGRSGG